LLFFNTSETNAYGPACDSGAPQENSPAVRDRVHASMREGASLRVKGRQKDVQKPGEKCVCCRVIPAAEPGSVCSRCFIAARCSGHRQKHHIRQCVL